MMSTNTVSDSANVTFTSVLGTTFRCSMPKPLRDGRQQVDRQQVHEVEEEHPAEDGERERRDELAVVP